MSGRRETVKSQMVVVCQPAAFGVWSLEFGVCWFRFWGLGFGVRSLGGWGLSCVIWSSGFSFGVWVAGRRRGGGYTAEKLVCHFRICLSHENDDNMPKVDDAFTKLSPFTIVVLHSWSRLGGGSNLSLRHLVLTPAKRAT